MARKRCPYCDRRLPYAGRRCLHCDWSIHEHELEPGGGVPWWRRRALWSIVVGAALLTSLGMAYRNAPELADWYAGIAAQHLIAEASPLVTLDRNSEAFYFCIRQVAKQMDGDYSVETFPSLEESELTVLGNEHYRIASFVDEVRESGERVRHSFSCDVSFQDGRWQLDDITVNERYVIRDNVAPALARSGTAR